MVDPRSPRCSRSSRSGPRERGEPEDGSRRRSTSPPADVLARARWPRSPRAMPRSSVANLDGTLVAYRRPLSGLRRRPVARDARRRPADLRAAAHATTCVSRAGRLRGRTATPMLRRSRCCPSAAGWKVAVPREPVRMSSHGATAAAWARCAGIAAPKPPRAAAPAPEERCEFCAVDIGERARPRRRPQDHRLLCVCRPCYLLFGAARRRRRPLPRRRRGGPPGRRPGARRGALGRAADPRRPGLLLPPAGADAAAGVLPRARAAPPSPCSTWPRGHDIAGGEPGARRRSSPTSRRCCCAATTTASRCYLVPVDVCYELVGVVRAARGPVSAAAPRCGGGSTRFFDGARRSARSRRGGDGHDRGSADRRCRVDLDFTCDDVGGRPLRRRARPCVLKMRADRARAASGCTPLALRCQVRIEPVRRAYADAEAGKVGRPVRRPRPLGQHHAAAAAGLPDPGAARLHRRRRRSTWRCRAATTSTWPPTSTSPRSRTGRCRCCCCSAAPCSPGPRRRSSVSAGAVAQGDPGPDAGAVWREAMDAHFPGQAWLRLSRRPSTTWRRTAAARAGRLGRRRASGCSRRPSE